MTTARPTPLDYAPPLRRRRWGRLAAFALLLAAAVALAAPAWHASRAVADRLALLRAQSAALDHGAGHTPRGGTPSLLAAPIDFDRARGDAEPVAWPSPASQAGCLRVAHDLPARPAAGEPFLHARGGFIVYVALIEPCDVHAGVCLTGSVTRRGTLLDPPRTIGHFAECVPLADPRWRLATAGPPVHAGPWAMPEITTWHRPPLTVWPGVPDPADDRRVTFALDLGGRAGMVALAVDAAGRPSFAAGWGDERVGR